MKRKIYAVHDRDIKEFLAELGLLDRVIKGELKCAQCGCVLSLENIGIITILRGDSKICCDNIECFYELRSLIKEEKADETSKPLS